jgi:hypothetical protein
MTALEPSSQDKEDRYAHYQWHDHDKLLSWKQTLLAMCNNYGTFCGRWHSNEFWADTKKQINGLTEAQCRDKVIQIEREADGELANWRATQ